MESHDLLIRNLNAACARHGCGKVADELGISEHQLWAWRNGIHRPRNFDAVSWLTIWLAVGDTPWEGQLIMLNRALYRSPTEMQREQLTRAILQVMALALMGFDFAYDWHSSWPKRGRMLIMTPGLARDPGVELASYRKENCLRLWLRLPEGQFEITPDSAGVAKIADHLTRRRALLLQQAVDDFSHHAVDRRLAEA